MKPHWSILSEELRIWADQGLELPFWWRDDDATQLTPQLHHLLRLSDSAGVPVHIAVIPKGATQGLANRLAKAANVVPVVHGYAHQNHAPASEKKCEFGVHRKADDARADLRKGLQRLRTLFGDNLAPVFVPPWNRFSPDFYADLHRSGYGALSTYAPRRTKYAFGEMEQINTHIDPIDWKGSRSLVDCGLLIDRVVDVLKARRAGVQDNSEPMGFLTHHLVHDPAIWDFSAQFLETIMSGPLRLWTARDLHWRTKHEST